LNGMYNNVNRKIWNIWSKGGERYRVDSDRPLYVVTGFPRSGTSFLSRLVSLCGVSFGEESDLKAGRSINPHGFFENRRFFELVDAMLLEAGFKNSYAIPKGASLNAKGSYRRIKRMVTRIRMTRFLEDSQGRGADFGVKITPLALHLLRPHVQRMKVIGVFRDPHASVYSNTKIFGKGQPFSVMMEHWKETNKELLYHLAVNESILVSFDDLFNEKRTSAILEKLSRFIGGGDVAELNKVRDPSLYKQSSELKELRRIYPLDGETKEIFDALERAKV